METVQKNVYFKKFYEKHKDDEHICEECGGKYKFYNKSHHKNTKKHIFAVKRREYILKNAVPEKG
jgi:hypothetical protein